MGRADARAATGMPLFRGIAEEIESRVRLGVYSGMLPSVLSLSAEFGVARGTVERALDHLAAERALLARTSRGWCVQPAARPQDVSVVRSFAQWARAIGANPSGLFVSRSRARASAADIRALGVVRQSFVLRVVRVRALDGRPVMIERTTFPGWLIDPILELDHDAPSIADAVFARHGLSLGHAENRISADAAAALDCRLLGVRRGAPLLRVVRTTRFSDGRAFEHSDDRYLADAVSFSFVTSTTVGVTNVT